MRGKTASYDSGLSEHCCLKPIWMTSADVNVMVWGYWEVLVLKPDDGMYGLFQ